MRILIVEDEVQLSEALGAILEKNNYIVDRVFDGESGLDYILSDIYDGVILDIMLPKLNGIEVLQYIRKTSKIPVLMLTAFNDDDYKIKAFSGLCDGYIEKPFSLSLLETRINALLKRHYSNYSIFNYKDCQVNFTSYKATYKAEDVSVNAKELKILELLLKNENIVLTRNQIIDGVWKEDESIPYDRVVDAYIKELRKKLGLDCIKTIRNVGYKITIK